MKAYRKCEPEPDYFLINMDYPLLTGDKKFKKLRNKVKVDLHLGVS
ncbi:MAG: hypothetical protein HY266_04810 [Deltaproteobacteria bacterium]|nr:hypothetical protein [Deltaproteobacteria bacterium]MBI3753353.1 hypothetical protein [Deltaproteobacteria bacterium]